MSALPWSLRVKRRIGAFVCARIGHAKPRWFSARSRTDHKQRQLLMCPRCFAIMDVKRPGTRRMRREAWRKDWRQISE